MSKQKRWLLFPMIGIIPILVSLIRVLQGGAGLIGDRAIFALQVADSGRGSFPAVGQYSWHGWNHPGPLLFYIFAPFHWISGGAAWGIFVGVAIFSTTCLFLACWIAQRRKGGVGAGLAVIVMLLTWVSAGGLVAVDPWTPLLALALFVVFLFSAWAVTERDRVGLWLLFITGSLLVQVHVGYFPLITFVGLVALMTFWWSGGNQRSIGRPLLISVALFAPLLFHPHVAARNIVHLADYFTSTNEPSVGWSRALRVMSFEMSPRASWISGPTAKGVIGEAPTASLFWLVAVVMALIVATVVVYRAPITSQRSSMRATAPLIWSALVIGLVALTQVRGFLFPYIVLWRSVIVLMIVLWLLLVMMADQKLSQQKIATYIAYALLIISVGGGTVTAFDHRSVTEDVPNVQNVITQSVTFLGKHPLDDGETLLLRLGDGGLVGLYPALVYDFEQRGIASGIDAETTWVFGDRAVADDNVTQVWMVCDTGVAFSLLSSSPGASVVAQMTPFATSDEVTVTALQVSLANQLRAINRLDQLSSLDSPLVSFALSEVNVDQGMVGALGRLNSRTPEPGFRFGIVGFDVHKAPIPWWSLSAF